MNFVKKELIYNVNLTDDLSKKFTSAFRAIEETIELFNDRQAILKKDEE